VKLSAANRIVIAILALALLAIAFWMFILTPKREQADELDVQVESLEATLAESRATLAEGEAAKQGFSRNYQQLVVLGKAVPDSDESASLLIELNHISADAGVKFESLKVGSTDGAASEVAETPEEAPEVAPAPGEESTTGVPAAASVPATEAAAALQPIGATVGPAGLSVLPFDLGFRGTYFNVADFISGLDALVESKKNVAVDGRLVTLDGFALLGNAELGFPHLNANFSVTTYLVPPGQGVTAGATPSEPPSTESTVSANVAGAQ
jgi:Tfp pilus assembly protein PilO